MTPLKTWEPLEPGTVLRVAETRVFGGPSALLSMGAGELLVVQPYALPYLRFLHPASGQTVEVWEPHARNALELVD